MHPLLRVDREKAVIIGNVSRKIGKSSQERTGGYPISKQGGCAKGERNSGNWRDEDHKMEARRYMRILHGGQEITRSPGASRRFLRQDMAKCNAAKKTSAVSVSRLDAMRWHIGLTKADCDIRKEIYISPNDGGLIYVTTENYNIMIIHYGEIGEDCLQNLGDCFVNALCNNAQNIDIWLDTTSRIPSEAVGMFESLGRNIVNQNLRVEVAIHGQDQAIRMLNKAFAQGVSHAAKCRGLA